MLWVAKPAGSDLLVWWQPPCRRFNDLFVVRSSPLELHVHDLLMATQRQVEGLCEGECKSVNRTLWYYEFMAWTADRSVSTQLVSQLGHYGQ